MALFKYADTVMDYSPGPGFVLGGLDTAAATINSRMTQIATPQNMDKWLKGGTALVLRVKMSHTPFYTASNVRPSDPTDHTDPGYNWALMDAYNAMAILSAASGIGPGLSVIILNTGAGRIPQWLVNLGLTWTNAANGTVQLRFDTTEGKNEWKYFMQAFKERYQSSRNFFQLGCSEFLNGQTADQPVGFSGSGQKAGYAEVANYIHNLWEGKINYNFKIPDTTTKNLCLPAIGSFNPDPKLLTSGCADGVCDVNSVFGVMQSMQETGITSASNEGNGLILIPQGAYPSGHSNSFGYGPSTPAHYASFEEILEYYSMEGTIPVDNFWAVPSEYGNFGVPGAAGHTLAAIMAAYDKYCASGRDTFPKLQLNYDPEGTGGATEDSNVLILDTIHTSITTAAAQDLPHGLGATPKHARLLLTSATVDGTAAGGLRGSEGSTDLTRQGALGFRANNSVTPSATSVRGVTDHVVELLTAGGGVDGAATYTSADATNLRITYDNALAQASKALLTAMTGSDLTADQQNVSLTTNGATISITPHGGFVPDYIRVRSSGAANDDAFHNNMHYIRGAASNYGGVNQWCGAWHVINGAAAPAGSAAERVRADCVAFAVNASGAVIWSARIVGWGATIDLLIEGGDANCDIQVDLFKMANCLVKCGVAYSPNSTADYSSGDVVYSEKVTAPAISGITLGLDTPERVEMLVTQASDLDVAYISSVAGVMGEVRIDGVNDNEFTERFRNQIGSTNSGTASFIKSRAFEFVNHSASQTLLAGDYDSFSGSAVLIDWDNVPTYPFVMPYVAFQFSAPSVDAVAAIDDLVLTATGQTSAKTTFTPISRAEIYRFYLSIDSGPYLLVEARTAAQVASDTGYNYLNLPAGTDIAAYVVVVGANGLPSDNSNIATETTDTPVDNSAPSTGQIISAVWDNDKRELTLVWTLATDSVTAQAALRYNVYGTNGPSLAYTAPMFSDVGVTQRIIPYDLLGSPGTWIFGVRAQDAAPNEETNVVTQTVVIPDAMAYLTTGTLELENNTGTPISIGTAVKIAYGPVGADVDSLFENVVIAVDAVVEDIGGLGLVKAEYSLGGSGFAPYMIYILNADNTLTVVCGGQGIVA